MARNAERLGRELFRQVNKARAGVSTFRSIGIKSAASVADQACSAAIGFLAIIFVGRVMGVEQLGVFAITAIIVVMGRMIQMSIILDAMAVFGPRRSVEERSGYLGFLFGLQLVLVGGISIVAGVAAIVLGLFDVIQQPMVRAVIGCLIYLNCIGFQHLIRQSFYVDYKPILALAQSLVFLIIVIVGMKALSFFDYPSIFQLYLVLSSSSLLICIIYGSRFIKEIKNPSRRFMKQYLKEHLEYGKWVLVAAPLVIACYHGYFILTTLVLGSAETGYLKAAEVLVSPFAQIGGGLNMMLIPLASRHVDGMKCRQQLYFTGRMLGALFLAAVVYIIVILSLSVELLQFFFGAQFEVGNALALLPALVFVPLITALEKPAVVMLSSLKRPDIFFRAGLASAVLTGSIGTMLIFHLGILGAGIGMCLSWLTFSIGMWLGLAIVWRKAATEEKQRA